MKTSPGLSLRPVLGWALGFVVLTMLAQAVSDTYGGWRFIRSAYEAGARWQLFTAQWVHFSVAHAALNVAVMMLMLLAFRGLVNASTQWLALLGAYLGVATVLAMDTQCAYYAGASGALHGFWAGNALGLLIFSPPAFQPSVRIRLLGGVLLAALALKLSLQQGAVLGGLPVYFPAHVAGAIGGIVAVMLYAVLRRWRFR